MATLNKLKLFLLLTFGLLFLFTQDSLAQYIDTTKHCATFEYGTFKQFNGLKNNEVCVIDKADMPSWDKYSVMRLSIDEIKVPYSSVYGDSGLWAVIKNTTTSQNEWGTSDCDDGFPSSFITTLGLAVYNRTLFGAQDLVPYLTVPKTYYNVKTAIIRSCLPGKIQTTIQTGVNNSQCRDYYCTKRWYGKSCHNVPRTMTFNPGNFPSWEFPGCGLNTDENSMSLTTNAPLNSGSNRIEVSQEGSFTLNWSLSNPSSSCTLSGKNATNPSEAFERKIGVGEVGVNAATGQITPKSDTFTFNYAKEGIYTYTLSCAGVLDGKTSPTRGVVSKSIKIFVGDIPPSPIVNSFDIVPSEKLTTPEASIADTVNYAMSITDSFQLKWDVQHADTAPSARPVKVWRQIGSNKKIILSTNTIKNLENPQTIKFAAEDRTGIYTFWIEVVGEKFPELTTESNKIRIAATGQGAADVPGVTFSADKTEIEKNESVVLTWNVSGSSDIIIDHNLGKVQPSDSTTVNPTVTTTYTLTAKNSIPGNPDGKKSITIVVKTPEIVIPELKEFVAPENVEFEGQEGTPTEKGAVDLKVNKVDGPITLNAPAKFTLSWNLDTYCLATGSWLTVKTKAGSETITLNKNGKYTYNLYCPGGYGSDSVEVNVVNSEINGLLSSAFGSEAEGASMPVAEASISLDSINYSQDLKVIRGEPVTIYVKVDSDLDGDGWVTRDSSGFWSDLMSYGGYCLYNDKLSKDPQFTGMVESPETRENCNAKLGTFTFNDEPGTYQYGVFRLLQSDQRFSNISYVNIVVENPPAPTSGPAIDLRINGNDSAEQILGTPANYTLSWNVKNATSCNATGSWTGSKEISGSQNFVSSSKKDFEYILTCMGDLGTNTKSIKLRVAETPACTFTAMPPLIVKSSSFVTDSQLSWRCDYADTCTLSPNITTAINTYGTLRVSPNETTNYVLNCSNSSVSKSFEAKVEVTQ